MSIHADDQTMHLGFALILIFHVVVSYLTVSIYGLSFITVFAAPALFLFYCAVMQPIVILALAGLIVLYHIAPSGE